MKSIGKQILGIFLAVLGAFIIYLSIDKHLIEIFLISGAILFIIGLCFFIAGVLSHFKEKKSKRNKSIDSVSNNKTLSKGASKKNSRANKKGGKKIVDKVKNSKKSSNPNEVLKKPSSKSNNSTKELEFTPKYERPVQVSRKPIKKSVLDDVSDAPDVSEITPVDKSQEIFDALANDEFIEPEHSEGRKEIPQIKVPNSQKSNANSKKSNISPSQPNEDKDNNIAEIEEDKITLDDLKNCVLTSEGETCYKQAFELLVDNAKTEILLETASIKDLNKDFSSKISSLNVRLIVQEFDIKDESVMVIANSYKEQGAHIKILPFVSATNLIVDGQNALIVSNNEVDDELEFGAIYDEMKEILEIRNSFEKSWDVATDFDSLSKN